jgi:hypothetical protein
VSPRPQHPLIHFAKERFLRTEAFAPLAHRAIVPPEVPRSQGFSMAGSGHSH